MKRFGVFLAAVAVLAAGTTSSADTVKFKKKPLPLHGQIIRMSNAEIEIETLGANAIVKKAPVNEIEFVAFDDEPSALGRARANVLEGEYEEAAQTLDRLKPDEDKRPEIGAEIEFYKALCAAQLALAGNGEIAAAGRQMNDFVKNYPSNIHYFEACQLVGDLLVAKGAYSAAQKYYSELANSPFEDFKMRAGIGLGRALLAQAKTAEALRAFEEVLGNDSTSELAESQRLFAKLGKARCLAKMKRGDEAVRMAQDIVDKADAKDKALMADAYVTLGIALRQANRPKDALMAFLHVDVLYDSVPDLHAQALANLVDVFLELHKPDHAGACKHTLLKEYPNSPWAKQAE